MRQTKQYYDIPFLVMLQILDTEKWFIAFEQGSVKILTYSEEIRDAKIKPPEIIGNMAVANRCNDAN